MTEKLFNSYSQPVPPLRYDIQRIPFHQNGESLLHFYDTLGYATPDFALPIDSETILSLLDGNRSVDEIMKFSSNGITKEQVLNYIKYLDEHALLQSEFFAHKAEQIESEYEGADSHTCTTAGISYPTDPEELNALLDNAFSEYGNTEAVSSAKALYAPHIDPRVGMESYVKAFSSIRDLSPKRVVILATSHYSGLYNQLYEEAPFIVSGKTFKMPNGSVRSDQASIEKLHHFFDELSLAGISFNDRAHRIEHSIELHLLFLNHIWNHEFEILPVLVAGFDELLYSDNSFREQQLFTFSGYLEDEFGNDPDTFFLISGDLSHVGRKFGDEKPASEMFDVIKSNDQMFLDFGANTDEEGMLKLMKKDYDPFRICGFPPLLTFINAFPNLKGEVLSYDLWDERERESAVSFGSILYQ